RTLGSEVTIDTDAAGYGWFIDSTPSTDSEFQRQTGSGQWLAAPSSPAYGEMDLLTVALHELGHVLGYADVSPEEPSRDLMVATLEAGERRPVSDSHGHARVAMEGTKEGLPSALQPAKPWLLDFLTDGAWQACDHPNQRIQIVI
ncbi:MAG: hypothetical protein QHH30_10290, partial [candidate division NC10 bacterium]|nr:hypothetical protein [candidate division NC10 bacterium]